jgi:hypothetical protein
MNPTLMHQIAQERQADLLREAEEYRRARLAARPTVLIRITARIPRFPTGSRRRKRTSAAGTKRATAPPISAATGTIASVATPLSSLTSALATEQAPMRPARGD